MPSSRRRTWTSWWQNDIPCAFSPFDAASNASFLTSILGPSFVRRALDTQQSSSHPILQRWRTDGAIAFLELNGLAEDLRTVHETDGFSLVLQDLKRPATCLATWHTIHMAALVSRSSSIRLVKFFPQTSETAPDFQLDVAGGQQVACEAKLLEESGDSQRFTRFAKELANSALKNILKDSKRALAATVVVRDVNRIPDLAVICSSLRSEIAAMTSSSRELRTRDFNLFVYRHELAKDRVDEYGLIRVLCPRSNKESLRVHSRSAQASKQLLSGSTATFPGILMLGVTDYQDPNTVVEMFRRRFSSGQYAGISTVVIVQRNVHLDRPVRTVVDSLAAVHNPLAARPAPDLELRPIGATRKLAGLAASDVPCYGYLQMNVRAKGPINLGFPQSRTLSRAELIGPD